MGVWLTTLHSAFIAQIPLQGFWHLLFIHARLFEHSEFDIHSGRQFGGEPIISDPQEHVAWLLISLHIELDPQGDGEQGFIWTGCMSNISRSQFENGFPLNPLLQVQNGLWFMTSHLAFLPQTPTQGFMHFWLLQASFWEQSESRTHSGLQEGGIPTYWGKQEQILCSFKTRHWEYEPHGLGSQGFVFTGAEEILSILNFLSGFNSKVKYTYYGKVYNQRMDFQTFLVDSYM
jgi:hypothetical protein